MAYIHFSLRAFRAECLESVAKQSETTTPAPWYIFNGLIVVSYSSLSSKAQYHFIDLSNVKFYSELKTTINIQWMIFSASSTPILRIFKHLVLPPFQLLLLLLSNPYIQSRATLSRTCHFTARIQVQIKIIQHFWLQFANGKDARKDHGTCGQTDGTVRS
ncbi:hypothetical protein BKA81DRAFT_40317 [Phyllosticta paracitricarpa]